MRTFSIGKSKRVYATRFSPSGRLLAAVGGDRLPRVWDSFTGEVQTGSEVEETSSGYDLTFLDESRLVFAGQSLRLWNLSTNEWTLLVPGFRFGRKIVLSPDGRYLAEGDQTTSTDWGGGPGLVLYDTTTWEILPPVPEAENTTGAIAFSADGRLMASGHIVRVGEKTRHIGMINMDYTVNDYDYVVHVREVPSGRIVQSIPGWGQGVRFLAFSPDGKLLAGTAGPKLRVWDLTANQEVSSQKRGTKHFQGLAFTEDGRQLITVGNDTTVRVWSAQTLAETATYTWQIGSLINLSLAPDGVRAAAGSDRGKIILWDLEL